MVTLFAPGGEVDRGIAVAVESMTTPTDKVPVGQGQLGVANTTARADLTRRKPAISEHHGAAAPVLLIRDHAAELGPSSIADRTRQTAIAQHASDIQVLQDEPIVDFDQTCSDLVQKMTTNIGNTGVVAPQSRGRLPPIVGTSQLSCNRLGKATLLAHSANQWFGRIADASDFGTVTGSCDKERRQATIYTYPTAAVGSISRLVSVASIQVGGFHIQRDPPPTALLADGCEQDLRGTRGQHPPQSPCVVMNRYCPDPRQRHRPRSIVVTNPDQAATVV